MSDYKELVRRLRREVTANGQDAADAIEKLSAEVERRADFMARAGYRPCDIPACNCDSWHGGHANERLRELRDELDTNGTTILGAVQKLKAEVERLKQERDEARETVARLQETLEAYGDGGNEGPSMHAFLGDYQLIKGALGGSYTAEAFEALKDKAMELDELRIEVEAWREKPWAKQLRAQSVTIAQLSARVALLEGYVNCSRG